MRARGVWAAMVGVALGTGFGACDPGFTIDPVGFCLDEPGSPQCSGAGTGGGGGSSSTGGGAGRGGSGATGGGGGTGGSGGGGGLLCEGPRVNCSGACVDISATDAQNCGACGRQCLGAATCAAGACVPEAVAADEVAPYALAQDASHLYWVSPASKGSVNDSRLRRAAKAGGAAESVFDGVRVRARSLGSDGTRFYWGDLGASPSDTPNQRLVSAAPGDLGPQPVAVGQAGVEHLALGGGRVYWSVLGVSAVRGKLADGTGPISPEIFGQANPRWVVVDAEAVPYWVAVDAAGTGREVRRFVAPSGFEAVAIGPDLVAVELAGERYYWADRAAGTVQSRLRLSPAEAPTSEFDGRGTVEGFALVVAGGGGVAGAGGAAGAGGMAGAGGVAGAAGAAGASGAAGAGGAVGTGEVTLYVLTAQGRQLRAWRKGPDDAEPLLLGEVTAKADPYNGNPFGAAYLLVDDAYLYFTDVGTVDTSQVVPVSQGDGAVYRVAR